MKLLPHTLNQQFLLNLVHVRECIIDGTVLQQHNLGGKFNSTHLPTHIQPVLCLHVILEQILTNYNDEQKENDRMAWLLSI